MKTRKIQLCFALTICVLLFICSCSKNQPLSPYSPSQIAEAIVAAQENIPELHPLSPEDDYYPEYLDNIYQIGVDAIKD